MTKKKTDDDVNFEEVATNLAAELAQANDALLRERADAANVRRRADEDRAKMAGFYKANVVREMLPFIDNFDLALKHAPIQLSEPNTQDPDKWYDWALGMNSLRKQVDTILSKLGVEKIKTVGEKFDPKLHNAISMEEADSSNEASAELEEIVSEELQSGYMLGDEVIRHAMVRVIVQ
jgi:molecular chaperone GrpE